MIIEPKNIAFQQEDLFDCLNKYYQKKFIKTIINYDVFYDQRTKLTHLRINFRNGKTVEFRYTYKFAMNEFKRLGIKNSCCTLEDFSDLFIKDIINALKHN